jgi:hypothetical protein
MCWLLRTSKDLGGRPPLASRCISLSWLFFHGGNTDEKDPSRISTLSAKKRCVSCVPDLQIHVACERAVAEGVLADVLSPIERRRGMLLPNTI